MGLALNETEWEILGGAIAGAAVITALLVALCCWHRRKLRGSSREEEHLINNQRASRAATAVPVEAPAANTLDPAAWNRINVWVIDICRYFQNGDLDPLTTDEVDAEDPHNNTHRSNQGGMNSFGHLATPGNDDMPNTPRSQVTLSPRVSVGVTDGVSPSRPF